MEFLVELINEDKFKSLIPIYPISCLRRVVTLIKISLRILCKMFYDINFFVEYMELLLFILLLVSVKLYFARVFAHFYKYLVWSEKILIQSAQYINGR